MLLGQFVLVGEYAVATVDVAPCEGLRGLLEEVGPHLGFVRHGRIKPRVRQCIDWMRDPGGAWHRKACAEIVDGGGAKRRPTLLVLIGILRQGERGRDQLGAAVLGVVKPVVQEIAQSDPRLFSLTDLLVGRRHRVQMLSRVHQSSSWSHDRQRMLTSLLYHIELGEQGAQRRIEMVELLDLLVWNIAINQPLRLDACANPQLAAEQLDIPAVLWATREQFERQDILGFRDIHLEHCLGAPERALGHPRAGAKKVAEQIIHPGHREPVPAGHRADGRFEPLVKRRGGRVIDIHQQYVNIIGGAPAMQLGEHEGSPEEKQTHRLRHAHLLQFLTEISQVRFNIMRLHSCDPFCAAPSIL